MDESTSAKRTGIKVLYIPRKKLGDAILCSPALRLLRRHLPGARIDACVNPYNKPAFDGLPFVDHLHVLPPAGKGVARLRPGTRARRRDVVARMNAERYDVVVFGGLGPHPNLRDVTRNLHATRFVGCMNPGQPVDIDVEQPVSHRDAGRLHAVEINLGMLEALGIRHAGEREPLDLFLDPALRSRMEIGRLGHAPVAVHVSVDNRGKRWPLNRFLELSEWIVATHGHPVLLLCAPGDRGIRSARLRQWMRRNRQAVQIRMLRTSSFADLAAALSVCRRVVCHDSAVVHAAAALRKPVLGFYLAKNVAGWYPWGVPHVIAQGHDRLHEVCVEDAAAAYDRLLALDGRTLPFAPAAARQ